MTSERIKEIQEQTAYPNSVSVQQALLKVWNECQQEHNKQCAINGVINWVACKEALPNHQTDVMTYSKEFEVRNGRCMQAGSWFVNGYPKLVDVTHWAELPKPPCL